MREQLKIQTSCNKSGNLQCDGNNLTPSSRRSKRMKSMDLSKPLIIVFPGEDVAMKYGLTAKQSTQIQQILDGNCDIGSDADSVSVNGDGSFRDHAEDVHTPGSAVSAYPKIRSSLLPKFLEDEKVKVLSPSINMQKQDCKGTESASRNVASLRSFRSGTNVTNKTPLKDGQQNTARISLSSNSNKNVIGKVRRSRASTPGTVKSSSSGAKVLGCVGGGSQPQLYRPPYLHYDADSDDDFFVQSMIRVTCPPLHQRSSRNRSHVAVSEGSSTARQYTSSFLFDVRLLENMITILERELVESERSIHVLQVNKPAADVYDSVSSCAGATSDSVSHVHLGYHPLTNQLECTCMQGIREAERELKAVHQLLELVKLPNTSPLDFQKCFQSDDNPPVASTVDASSHLSDIDIPDSTSVAIAQQRSAVKEHKRPPLTGDRTSPSRQGRRPEPPFLSPPGRDPNSSSGTTQTITGPGKIPVQAESGQVAAEHFPSYSSPEQLYALLPIDRVLPLLARIYSEYHTKREENIESTSSSTGSGGKCVAGKSASVPKDRIRSSQDLNENVLAENLGLGVFVDSMNKSNDTYDCCAQVIPSDCVLRLLNKKSMGSLEHCGTGTDDSVLRVSDVLLQHQASLLQVYDYWLQKRLSVAQSNPYAVSLIRGYHYYRWMPNWDLQVGDSMPPPAYPDDSLPTNPLGASAEPVSIRPATKGRPRKLPLVTASPSSLLSRANVYMRHVLRNDLDRSRLIVDRLVRREKTKRELSRLSSEAVQDAIECYSTDANVSVYRNGKKKFKKAIVNSQDTSMKSKEKLLLAREMVGSFLPDGSSGVGIVDGSEEVKVAQVTSERPPAEVLTRTRLTGALSRRRLKQQHANSSNRSSPRCQASEVPEKSNKMTKLQRMLQLLS